MYHVKERTALSLTEAAPTVDQRGAASSSNLVISDHHDHPKYSALTRS